MQEQHLMRLRHYCEAAKSKVVGSQAGFCYGFVRTETVNPSLLRTLSGHSRPEKVT